MSTRAVLVLATMLVGCDDTVFPQHIVEYENDWTGVSAFTYNTCRGCHPSVAEPSWPEALEEDLLSEEGLYVVPGDPAASYFWRVLSDADREEGDLRMPATGSLPPEQIEFIREWILAGAPL